MPRCVNRASGCWGGRKVPGSAGQLTPVHPEPGTVTSAADGFLAERQPNDRRARLRLPELEHLTAGPKLHTRPRGGPQGLGSGR
jgi:hypothetical protein